MPTFRITSPDGKTYRITAPEGTTQEQALAQLQQHLGSPAEPDPNRGPIQKWGEVGTGLWRGLAQDAATSGRVLSHLPTGALNPIPGVGPAARLIQGLGPAAGRWGDQPTSSNYEETGRVLGRDVVPMLVPGGGGRIATRVGEGVMRNAPTLAQLIYALHDPIGALMGRTALHDLGAMAKLQAIAQALAPGFGRGVGALTRGAERIGEGELGQAIPGAPQDAQDTQDPGTQPPPSVNPVPSPADPGSTGPARGRQPGLDVDTEPPVANRSGRGDRLPLYNPAAN